jgi:hypothetical protein
LPTLAARQVASQISSALVTSTTWWQARPEF